LEHLRFIHIELSPPQHPPREKRTTHRNFFFFIGNIPVLVDRLEQQAGAGALTKVRIISNIEEAAALLGDSVGSSSGLGVIASTKQQANEGLKGPLQLQVAEHS